MKKEGIIILITTRVINRYVGSLLLAAIALTLFSCEPEPEPEHWSVKYGTKYNPEREKLGIRPLPDDFLIGEVTPGWYLPWLDSTSTEPKAYYAQKILTFYDDTLAFEVDEFRLLQFKEPNCGNTLAMLSYAYAYDYGKNIGFSPDTISWRYSYFVNPYPEDPDSLTLTLHTIDIEDSKEKADSILHSWGLTYP